MPITLVLLLVGQVLEPSPPPLPLTADAPVETAVTPEPETSHTLELHQELAELRAAPSIGVSTGLTAVGLVSAIGAIASWLVLMNTTCPPAIDRVAPCGPQVAPLLAAITLTVLGAVFTPIGAVRLAMALSAPSRISEIEDELKIESQTDAVR